LALSSITKSGSTATRAGVRQYQSGAPSIQIPSGNMTVGPYHQLTPMAAPPITSTPVAAPTQPYTPPPDPNLQAKQGLLTRARDDAYGQIQYDEGRVKQEYGFDDVSNPFSRAALLQRSFQERQRGTTNTLAARGQLYSGAIQNQRALDQRGYDQAYDSTKRSYDDALQGIISRRNSVGRAFDEGNLDAIQQSQDRQLQNRPDPLTLDPGTAATEGAPVSNLTPAQERRRKRKELGYTDVRKLTAAQKKKLKALGLL
jgi:hypothetical protein